MSSTLKKYLNVLEFISKIKDKRVREGVLKQYANFDDFYQALYEIAINLVNKNFPLSNEIKKKFKPHKQKILSLTRNNKSARVRRKKVIQTGGFLPLLIPLLLSLLSQ